MQRDRYRFGRYGYPSGDQKLRPNFFFNAKSKGLRGTGLGQRLVSVEEEKGERLIKGRLCFQPCVSPRSLPHTTAGSLVFILLFWTNHRQACPILAGESLIGQCSHRSTKMAAVAEDCRGLRSFWMVLECLKLRNKKKQY